ATLNDHIIEINLCIALTFDDLVQVVYVALVMLAVVERDRLGADVRRQRVLRPGQRGQGEGTARGGLCGSIALGLHDASLESSWVGLTRHECPAAEARR